MNSNQPIEARACWHISSTKSELQVERMPALQPDQCRIRSFHSLVSLGTERTVAGGGVPNRMFEEMKAPYMGGDFGFPVKYGYSLVGEVIQGPAEYLGQRIHAMHPHQDVCQVNVADVFRIPDTVPTRRAVLASNLETAINAVWDSGVSIGDRVLVIGFGMVGSLLCRLLSGITGVNPVVFEINEARCRWAEQMGFEIAYSDIPDDVFDCSFNTSGSGTGLQQGIDAVGYEGRIIELSWYGEQSVHLQLGHTFHSRRKQIISSQVSVLPAGRSRRWNHKRRKSLVFDLLKNDAFDEHLTHSISFEALPDFFYDLRAGKLDGLGYVVDYRG